MVQAALARLKTLRILTGLVIPTTVRCCLPKIADTLGWRLQITIVNLNFENTDNVTHVLVMNFYGSVGEDIDADDDGYVDYAPWTDTVDGVRIIFDPNGGDLTYLMDEEIGPTVDGYAPAHVYRYTVPAGTLQSVPMIPTIQILSTPQDQ